MSKKISKFLTLGLAVSMLVGSLAGCGKKPVEQPTVDPAPEQQVENVEKENEVEKPEKITMMINIGIQQEDGLDEWAKEFEAKTGIKLEIQSIRGAEYYQKLELAFASNQAPDVFTVGDGKLPVYASQGALVDLTELAKNSEIIQKMDQSVIGGAEVSGKLYGIPYEGGGGPVTYMRQDWLEELGKEVTTTYDEFIDVLRAFKTIAPDAIPLTSPGLMAGEAKMYLTPFYQDASPEFVNVDGKWVDGMAQPNMKDALARMRDAYAEGLIDTEVVTNKTSTCRDKWYAGKVGVFSYWAGNWNTLLEDRVQATVPTAKVVAAPALEGTHYDIRVPAVMAISPLAKNPEGIFKYFIEYMHDGQEGSVLFQHGVEGLHWEQKDGNYAHLPKISKPEEINDKAFITPALSLEEITIPGYRHDLDPRVVTSIDVIKRDGVQQVSVPASKMLGRISSDLLALRDKTVSTVVLGEADLEKALAEYEAESKNLGIDQVLEELNAN